MHERSPRVDVRRRGPESKGVAMARTRRVGLISAFSVLAILLAVTPALPQTAPVLTPGPRVWVDHVAEIEQYLKSAEIVGMEEIGVGVTKPRRATLAPGGPVEKIAWKAIRPGRYSGFWESYKSEIAAYELDRILELNMVPPTVERRYENQQASAMLWIDGAVMLGDVLKKGLKDPNLHRWNQNLHRAQVFDDLSGNIDPNQGNWLFDTAWNYYKIDCSRCFTDTLKMPHDVKKTIKRIDRPFFERLKALDRDTVRRAIGELLTENNALPALFNRRDAIVKAFEELAKQNGEAAVFEAWHAQ
jgi:hypothetical protein